MSLRIVARKSLGQNFLVDVNIAKKIVNALGASAGDNVIEIGPGVGALTKELVEQKTRFTAVEIDERAFNLLNEQYPKSDYPSFNLVLKDIREFNLNTIATDDDRIKVIGNIPYNISGDILFWVLQNSAIVEKVILMTQKEVAQRLSSPPNTKTYGILTVLIAFLGSARIVFDVHPNCFRPVPRVNSSIIEIKIERRYEKKYFDEYIKLVKASFSQRRKTLGNSMKTYLSSRKIEVEQFKENPKMNEYLQKRAENLTCFDFQYILDEVLKIWEK